jgi:hypothetical protein
MPAVLDAIEESWAAIEINGGPEPPRSPASLDPRGAAAADPIRDFDGRPLRERLDNVRWGVDMARRGWLTAGQVLNTLDVDAFGAAVRP